MKYLSYIVKKEIQTRKFLKNKGFSKKSVEEILKKGYVLNGKKVYKSKELSPACEIKIKIPVEDLDYEPIEGNLKIVYEDENALVISKGAGITMNSKGQISLANHLAFYFRKNNIESKIRFVNRLDMNTSGLLIVAKNKFAQSYYQNMLENNLIEKKYLALVDGKLEIDRQVAIKLAYDREDKKYKISEQGKIAKTIFKTIKVYNKFSLIECKILTGKTHQIRLSLSFLSHPIVGDRLYGSKIKIDRFLLHSYYLEFKSFYAEENILIKDYPDFSGFCSYL